MKRMIVIGAGILGASTAYHLAKKGVQVTVVDRNDPGQATDAAAGIICPWLSQRRNQAWYGLAKRGAHFYPGLIQELEKEGEEKTGYARVGVLSISKESEKMNAMEKRAIKRKETAPEMGEIIRLSSKETRSFFPVLRADFSSLKVTGAARVDGRSLRDSLLQAAIHKGAKLIKGSARLYHNQNCVTGVEVNGQSLTADEVIVCAGAWASSLFEPLHIQFNVHFQKAQIIHLELPDSDTNLWPVIMPPSNQYLLAFENSRIVIGATHENDTDGYDTRITAGGMQEVFNKALEIAPGLENATYLETRVGFRPFTPGFLPVIGRIPNWKGILVANGLGASGLTMGPYLGFELANLALHLETQLDLSLYDVRNALS